MKVFAVLVDVTQKRVDRPVPTVPNSVDVDVNGTSIWCGNSALRMDINLFDHSS